METIDWVNSPPHYTSHGSGVEVIEITRHCSFDIGNAIKYIMRHEHKGSAKQDLDKALWYLNDHLKNFGDKFHVSKPFRKALCKWLDYEASFGENSRYMLIECLEWLETGDVRHAAQALDKYITDGKVA